MSWLIYPDGTQQSVEVVCRRLWGRVEVKILSGPEVGQVRIVGINELTAS